MHCLRTLARNGLGVRVRFVHTIRPPTAWIARTLALLLSYGSEGR